MSGIGKFPVLALSPGVLLFGHVLVNSSKEMQMVVTNTSIVPAQFWVRKGEDDKFFGANSVFSIHPTEGIIGPTSCITLKVCCTLKLPLFSSPVNWHVETERNNRLLGLRDKFQNQPYLCA